MLLFYTLQCFHFTSFSRCTLLVLKFFPVALLFMLRYSQKCSQYRHKHLRWIALQQQLTTPIDTIAKLSSLLVGVLATRLLFPCCTFFMMHSFHVALFSCALFSCCTSFMLHFFHVALFSCCTRFMLQSSHVAISSCCTLSILQFFNIKHWKGMKDRKNNQKHYTRHCELVSPLFHYCFTIISLLFHYYFTTISLLVSL